MAARMAPRADRPRVSTWAVASPSKTKTMPSPDAMAASPSPKGSGRKLPATRTARATAAGRGMRRASGRLGQGRGRRSEIFTVRPASQRLAASITAPEAAMATGASRIRSGKRISPGRLSRARMVASRPDILSSAAP